MSRPTASRWPPADSSERITPDHLLGRVNATMRFLMTGALAVAAALAGAIGQYAGVPTATWLAATGVALAWVPLVLSPVRQMRTSTGRD